MPDLLIYLPWIWTCFLAGDTSERQSFTRTITHHIKFYILLV